MALFETADLQVQTDGVSVIRRAFGPRQSASYLVTQITRDLVLMGAIPVHVEWVDGWWLISSAKDWLRDSEGSVSWRFTHIVHFPEAGREACHSEVLLTAFADAVATRGATGGITWIAGDPERWTLPARMRRRLRDDTGRIVAFRSRDDQLQREPALEDLHRAG